MPWEIRQIILVIHIFLAIIWVGGIFFIGWGVFPSVRSMPFTQQRQFFLAIMNWSHRLLTTAGIGVIATGIILGTIFGPIKQWNDVWHTTYGTIWFTALTIALFTLLWGVFVAYRQSIRVFSNVDLWESADTGNTKPLKKALVITVLLESVEISGFIVLIICMVLL